MAPQAVLDRSRFRQILAELADKARTKLPESHGRIDKAVGLVLAGDIAYDRQTSMALVNSCSDAAKVYKVRGKVCECKDYDRAPQHLCKHVLGVMFLIRAQQVLDTETPQDLPAVEGAKSFKEQGVGVSHAALPEAPASANFRAMVGQFEVQFTLRGRDEGEVFGRLQTLLARKDVQPVPRPAPRQGQWKQRQYTSR
jgi:hypothetical protein